jgi:hypothetical protein
LVTGLTGFGGTDLNGFGNRPDRFLPNYPGKTGLIGFPNRLTGLAQWAVEKGF